MHQHGSALKPVQNWGLRGSTQKVHAERMCASAD